MDEQGIDRSRAGVGAGRPGFSGAGVHAGTARGGPATSRGRASSRGGWRCVAVMAGALGLVGVLSGCGGGGGAPAGLAASSERVGAATVTTPASTVPPSSFATQLPQGWMQRGFVPAADDVPNPERGFYRWAWTTLDRLSRDDAADAHANGYRLLYGLVRLDAYRSKPLPTALLDRLRNGFAAARAGGVKVVPRFVYNYPDSETAYRRAQDAPLDRVLQHIAQLEPVLRENADVIAHFQAGFVGAWGEWHTSSNKLNDEPARTRVRDALLAALPGEIAVQMRYPGHLIGWHPQPPTETQAFDGGAQSRLGAHNDCFLASDTDVGTYSEDPVQRERERDYMAAVARIAPYGGETCNALDDPNARPRNQCSDILAEGARFALTYLNDEYYTEAFHDVWRAQGCYAEVRRSMGYRFELLEWAHAPEVTAGGALPVRLAVRNAGWARLYKARPLELWWRAADGRVVHRSRLAEADVRRWLPGATAAIEAQASAPPAAGMYELLLALPDGAPRLAGDPRYAVRFANADDPAAGQGWDTVAGAFRLGTQVVVR